jgi:TPR repeat protein
MAIECPVCRRVGVFRFHSQIRGLVAYLNQRGIADLRAGAAAGDIDSILHLAYAVGVGLGVEKDAEEATRLFRIGADAGDAASQFNLACSILAYSSGDRQEMRRWMLRAAEKGHRAAMRNISIIIDDEGTEPEEAQQWMRRAAEAGYAPAEYIVGLEKATMSDEVEEGNRMIGAAISKGLFHPLVQCAPG